MRPTLHFADPALIEHIITESKRILAEIGIEVRGQGLRDRLLAHGLPADAAGRILFPPAVVDSAIAAAPNRFALFDRGGQPFTVLGGDNVHFVPGSSGLHIHDHRSGDLRPAHTADFVEYVRLADGLPHIAYLATAFSTADVPAAVSDAWRLYLCLINSRKPVVSGAFTAQGVPRMAEIMTLFRQDGADLAARPFSIFTITATGNFRYGENSCQNLLDCVEAGIPVEIVPVTIMGMIAPVTLAEAAIFHTVDVLAGIVMAQIIRPGAPVLFGGAPATLHMRETTTPMLAIEALRLDVLYAAVGKRLGLPTQAYMALSDSKSLDAQAGAETFGSALLAALAGINSVSGPGMLDYVMTFSLPKLVFDDEVCGQALQFVRQTQPVGDISALDLARAQLADSHLLVHEHTRKHWPDQLYLPGPVYDRGDRGAWQKNGAKTLWRRAVEEVDERLSQYQPLETSPEVEREMRRLIEAGLPEGAALPVAPGANPQARIKRSRRERRFSRSGRTNP